METMLPCNVIDLAALVLVLVVGLFGLRRGLSGELARVISVVAAVWAGRAFYRPVGEQFYLATRLGEKESYALAFLAVLVGGLVFMLLVRLILRSLMEFTFKGNIERVGGFLCGAARGALLAGALIFLVSLWPHEGLHRLFAEESLVGRTLSENVPAVYEKLAERYPELPKIGAAAEFESEELGEVREDDGSEP